MNLGLGLGLSFGGARAAAPFVPTSLSGCVLWLRADLGTTIATGVSAWADQSPTGASFAQATGLSQPTVNASSINGQKGLTFAPPQNIVSTSHEAAWNLGAFTMLIAFKPATAITAYESILTMSTNGAWNDGWGTYFNVDGSLNVWSGSYSALAKAGVCAVGTPYIVRAEFTGTEISAWLNGVAGQSAQTATEADNSAAANIGDMVGGSAYAGDVDEVILYNRVLTSGEIAQVSAYTLARYGLAA